MKSYSEKFKIILTSKELEVIEYALEKYKEGYNDKGIDRIIKKLYTEGWK